MPTTIPKNEQPKELLGDDHPEWDKSKEKEWFPQGGGPIVYMLIGVVLFIIITLLVFVALMH